VYRTPDSERHRQTARQFVLAAGAVETARLLLLSKSDQYPGGLANSSGAVGRYFVDHPNVEATGFVDEPPNPSPIGFHTSESHQFYGHDSPGPGSIKLEFKNANPTSLPELAVRGGDSRTRNDVLDAIAGDAWGDELAARIDSQLGGKAEFTVRAQIEPLPSRDDAVTLNHDVTDDADNPVPDIDFDVGEHARETLEFAADLLRDIMDELGATNVTVDSPDDPRHAAHHIGTTRMGEDPESSVVDSRLRTHDLNNLTIASSSVFVTAGAMNPTLTIAALCLKAADHVAADL